jgi:hypothetical protein
MVETIVYYSLQRAPGSFRDNIIPSPIHSADEKQMAMEQCAQRVEMTFGDLKIVLFVGCDDIPDDQIYAWLNWLKMADIGMQPGFSKSRYSETLTADGNYVGETDEWEDEDDE